MKKPIIEIRNVGKKYDINHSRDRYVALRDILANILKNPFLFLKNKAKEATGFAKKEEFWALKDINFDIKKGEIIGIIGHNGAGKSTLLKILTGITPPSTGSIKMYGKVASLLEVGTGFHPELTGRENIFLNGAILGMTKKEIKTKFDDIVEFSGIEQFLDTPVKRYSSGMYVRLAFSVAAHMEPDILLVDEVLAVGDSDFQKKSLGKLNRVSKDNDRTIFFVSHNMHAIQKLCSKCILLDKGRVKMIGETRDVINTYLNLTDKIDSDNLKLDEHYSGLGGIIPTKTTLLQKDKALGFIDEGSSYALSLSWQKKVSDEIKDIECIFTIYNSEGLQITQLSSRSAGVLYSATENMNHGEWTCKVDRNLLPRGSYYVYIKIESKRGMEYDKANAFSFTVEPGFFEPGVDMVYRPKIFHQPQKWEK